MSKSKGSGKRKPHARYRVVRRHGFLVAELLDPGKKLTTAEVRRLIRALRERRMK
jgi:hypothetical protein